MLVLRCSRMLAPRARLAAPSAAFYSSKNQIPESNQFWMRHQIKAKDGFHKHINFERIVAGVALVSFVGCLAVPGNFFLDTICAASWIAHGFWGVEAMIGDYVPLIAPAVVAGILKKLWLVFCVVMFAAFVELNLRVGEHQGVGHILRAFFNM